MLNWGILSTAKIGIQHVIPAILNSNNGVANAVASRSKSKAKDLAERFAIPHVFGSYDEMLASDVVDAVYIPLPTSQHVEWAIKAANAGKHVLCEKPISLKAAEIDDIITARDQNNVLISEAYMVTYHPQWHKVRALIAEGAIGTLKHVQTAFSYHNTDPSNMRNIHQYKFLLKPFFSLYVYYDTVIQFCQLFLQKKIKKIFYLREIMLYRCLE